MSEVLASPPNWPSTETSDLIVSEGLNLHVSISGFLNLRTSVYLGEHVSRDKRIYLKVKIFVKI